MLNENSKASILSARVFAELVDCSAGITVGFISAKALSELKYFADKHGAVAAFGIAVFFLAAIFPELLPQRASLGKRVCGLSVAVSGGKTSFPKALLRNILKYAFLAPILVSALENKPFQALPCLISLLFILSDFLCMALRKDGRSIHGLISNTSLIHK